MRWRQGFGSVLEGRRAIENARVAAAELAVRRVEREEVAIFLAEDATAKASAAEVDDVAPCPGAPTVASRLAS